MKIVTKMMALGALAALLVSGAVLAFAPSTGVATADNTPIVTAEDTSANLTTLNLSVNVLVHVDGENTTLPGVNVTVYTVNITTDGEGNSTIVIKKVAEGQTDASGNVTFQLPEGKYAVSATYQGLRGFDWVNLTKDQISTVRLHGCDWDMMGSQSFPCNGSCDHLADRDRLRDRDMDRNSTCTQDNCSCGTLSGTGPIWDRDCGHAM